MGWTEPLAQALSMGIGWLRQDAGAGWPACPRGRRGRRKAAWRRRTTRARAGAKEVAGEGGRVLEFCEGTE